MADYIRPTPRNPILGLLADAMMGGLAYMEDPRRTQQMRGVGGLLSETRIPQLVERLAYGEPLTKGKGMTTRLHPDAEAALLTLGPEAVPIGRAATAAVRATKGLPVGGAIVYHGSPYRFNRFDPTKIGSGEGAQAFGYGHYTAEARPVAEEYMRLLGRPDTSMLSPAAKRAFDRAAKDIIDKTGDPKLVSPRYTANFAASKAKGSVADELMKYAENPPPRTGNLYTIDIPDEQVARMLDWDKPLSQQPKEIRDAINKTKSMLPANAMADLGGDLSLLYGKDITPNQFLNTWEAIAGRLGAGEEALRQAGIPGIRYLDQGSRGAGTGTSNFVVFPGEEDLLRILSVNGGLLSP